MNRYFIVFIASLKDDEILCSSSKIEVIKDNAVEVYCWHYFWTFLQNLRNPNRDPIGFYAKVQIFTKDLKEVEDIRFYCARKIQSLSDKQHSELESSVGYEILPWSNEYIPQVIEQEEV